MANITINKLRPVGYDFFADSESFLGDLSEQELNFVNGGFSPLIAFATASSVECATFIASFIVGVTAGISAVKNIK